MKPSHYIHIFAVIAIVALCFQIFSDFWLPMTIGALAMYLFALTLRKSP
ncbi:hypothetical protein OVA24_06870 [Luteolibacter sp. SL250]|nr:hypothetical protein [Luteolibacter sp. SL250]WAC21104.1 hypothetical protein OVA24_06870 [Luteolibacter sp. SL250]